MGPKRTNGLCDRPAVPLPAGAVPLCSPTIHLLRIRLLIVLMSTPERESNSYLQSVIRMARSVPKIESTQELLADPSISYLKVLTAPENPEVEYVQNLDVNRSLTKQAFTIVLLLYMA